MRRARPALVVSLALALAACAESRRATDTDGGSHRDGAALDGTALDATTDAAAPPTDAATADAGPKCGDHTYGTCDPGLTCFDCAAGGPLTNYLCSTPCTSDDDCTDPARPHCEIPPSGAGLKAFCTAGPPNFTCCWLCE